MAQSACQGWRICLVMIPREESLRESLRHTGGTTKVVMRLPPPKLRVRLLIGTAITLGGSKPKHTRRQAAGSFELAASLFTYEKKGTKQ